MTHFLQYISHPNYTNLWGQCVVILGSVCSMHCRGNIVLAWSFVFGCFLSLFTFVFHPPNIWWHRLMGQLMDRCFNKFCSCKQSALKCIVFEAPKSCDRRRRAALLIYFHSTWTGLYLWSRPVTGLQTASYKYQEDGHWTAYWPIDQILMHICLWSKRPRGLQSVLKKHKSLRLLNW